MDAVLIGKILGAIFLAGIPTAVTCYLVSTKKFKNKLVGILGAASCFIISLVGGLVLSLPTLAIFLLIAKFTASKTTDKANSAEDQKKIGQLQYLEKMYELRSKGALSQEEYEEVKERFKKSA